MAHNVRGFEFQFILDYLHQQSFKPKVIMKEMQIMMLEVEKIRILDSLNFLPIKLSAMPKAFNMAELKKRILPIPVLASRRIQLSRKMA